MEKIILAALLLAGMSQAKEQPKITPNMPSNGISTAGLGRFGSKTNYRVISAENFPGGFPTKRPSSPWSKICRPIQYTLFARHGHRHLGDSDMEAARDFAAQFREKYRNALGAKWFLNYTLPWNITDDKFLTKVGMEDMKAHGKRVAKLWPELSLDPKRTEFFSSTKSRTFESAKSFIDGFSSALGMNKVDFPLVSDNMKTRFYDYCDKYKFTVDDNDTAAIEAKKFLNGSEMTAVINRIKGRLGLRAEPFDPTTIDKDRGILKDLYYMCQAELAENITKPIWCYIFNDTDTFPMEYYLDLEDYYEASYGYKINQEMSCPLVKHIFSKMDSAVEAVRYNKEYQRGIFGFGHSGSLIPLFSAFGLFRPDEKPTASNFLQQKNRKFQMSKVAPFSGNVALALYECNTTNAALAELTPAEKNGLPVKMERFMVEVYSNEKLTKFPFCDKEFCSYRQVREAMGNYVTCSFKDVCSLKVPMAAGVVKVSVMTLVIGLVLAIMSIK